MTFINAVNVKHGFPAPWVQAPVQVRRASRTCCTIQRATLMMMQIVPVCLPSFASLHKEDGACHEVSVAATAAGQAIKPG